MLNLDYRDARPIYEQVRDGLRRLMVTGVIREGEKLPSVRALASSLAINPNTIQRAYESLEAEGYVCSVPGKGSFAAPHTGVDQGRRDSLLGRFDTVTAELLCTTAVTTAPVSTPASGWAVSRARACRRVSPAACCKASVRVSILYKKSAAPPNNCRIIHKRCSMPDAPFALCVCGTQTFVNFCETIPAGGCNPACKSLLLSSVNS